MRRSRLLQTCDRGYFAERNASYPDFLFDFKNLLQFIHVSPARDIVNDFFIGSTPLVSCPCQPSSKLLHCLLLQELSLLALVVPENRCVVQEFIAPLAISPSPSAGQLRSHTRIAYPLRESAPQRGRSRSTNCPITTCCCFACVLSVIRTKRCSTEDADYANQECRQSRSKTKQTRCPQNFVVSLA